MLQRAKIFLMENTLSMPRAKMLWPVSVHHRKLRSRDHTVGQRFKMYLKRSVLPNFLHLKKRCLLPMPNWWWFSRNWKTTIMICRILNLQFRMVNFGCCRPVMENVQVLRWWRWPLICLLKISLMKRQRWCVLNQTDLMNYFTLFFKRKHCNQRK